jgi:hypothetical protein
VRTTSDDQKGDATADYSSLAPNTSHPANADAMDFTGQANVPQTDLDTGKVIDDGGFDVKLSLADLSDSALQQAASLTKSGSLLWIFRFVNGYQASAAVARWNPAQGFTFGFNDYTTGSVQCGSDDEKCQTYPGDKQLQGTVDQKSGTITMSVPREYLNALNGPTGAGQRPTLNKAAVGSRFYDATAFSLGNLSPAPTVQSFLYPIDNPPAMDFLLPGPDAPRVETPTGGQGHCGNEIKGTKGKDKLAGTSESDKIRGGGKADKINGRAGNDCLAGQGGADKVSGGKGNDDVRGGRGKDRLKGGAGRDVIHARKGGRDRINCGPGRDTVLYSKKLDRVKHCEVKKHR